MIYLSPPHMSPLERELLLNAFDSNWVAPLGPYVEQFEQDFSNYIGVDHALALSSGTAALHLALLVLGVKPRDKVITSTLTFAATANAIKYVGADPIFIDCESQTWNMDPQLLEEALKKFYGQIAAVVSVDLYGRCADYDAIQALCYRYEVPLIEDAAEALGASFNNKRAGNFGRLAAFSFNGNKIMTTGGGGMLVSQNKTLIDRARYLSTQARMPTPYYQHEDIGFNYRLSNLLAAIGCGQLEVLNEHIQNRKKIHKRYIEEFKQLPGVEVFPEFSEKNTGNYWLTTVLIDENEFGQTPEELRQHLLENKIEARPVWKPMHLQPVFKKNLIFGGGVSEEIFRRGLCLPSGSSMTNEEHDFVVRKVKKNDQ